MWRRSSPPPTAANTSCAPPRNYIDYYSISYSYLHTVIERVRKRFPAEDCDKMEQMLSVISTELMPELDMLAKCRTRSSQIGR